ncbi:MAG: hypothetical protein Tsb007_04010 [Rhizobacter sp.]
MRRPWPTLVAMSALLLAPIGLHAPLMAQTASAAPAQARVIVKFKASSSVARALSVGAGGAMPRHAQTLGVRAGMSLVDGHAISPHSQVIHASGIGSAELAARLSQDAEIEYAVPDRRRHIAMTPNDPRYLGGQTTITPAVGQWYLRAPSAGVVSAINAEAAWNLATGSGVVVAVLDTGVRPDHPDLAVKLYPGYDFVADVATANDGNGRDADASDPGDWINGADLASGNFSPADCTEEGSSWHGTQTSALIGAATNNGVGMAGLGGDVMIVPVRVLGKCGGFDSDIVAGMRWAAGLTVPGVPANAHPARVLNMSLGGVGPCDPPYSEAITAINGAGAVVVVSAGNDGLAVGSPANCSGAIGVGGVRHTGTKVGYSSLGPEVALSAPAGNCVNETGACLYPLLTATNSGTTSPGTNTYSDGNNISVGTSFAAPLVAGTAALMLAADSTLTPAQVLAHLRAAARVFPSSGAGAGVSACQAPSSTPQDSECYCTTTTCGAGLLDANAAVARVVTSAQLIPVISYNASAITVGSSFTLDSSASVIPAGLTVTPAWTIQSGASIATITSANNASTLTLRADAAGDVVVRLSLTDTADLMNVKTRDVTVRVRATPPPLISGGGDSGGGGLGLAWLLGLAMGVAALQWQRLQRLHTQPVSTAVPRRPLHT